MTSKPKFERKKKSDNWVWIPGIEGSNHFKNLMDKLLPGIWEEGKYPYHVLAFVCTANELMKPREIQEVVYTYIEKLMKKAQAEQYEDASLDLYKQIHGIRKAKTKNRTKAKVGKRSDLGNIRFRSAAEANVARYLGTLGKQWLYEPEKFIFTTSYKRGAKWYIPDFKVGDEYIEVKGRLLSGDKWRLIRFKRDFPEEASKLTIYTWKKSGGVITLAKEHGFKICFIDEIDASKVPGWEGRK